MRKNLNFNTKNYVSISSFNVSREPFETISITDTFLNTNHKYLNGSSTSILVVDILASGLMEVKS
jgi:hypothetical protein